MIDETTDLVVKFAKSNGKNHNWRYKEVNTSLPVEEIKEACELLTTLDIFEQDGVKFFDSVLSAKFVTTTEVTLFTNASEELPEAPETEQSSALFPMPVSETGSKALPKTPTKIPEDRSPRMAISLEEKEAFNEKNHFPLPANTLPIDAVNLKEKSVPNPIEPTVLTERPQPTHIVQSQPATKSKKARKGLINRLLSRKTRENVDTEIRSHEPDDSG
ncbi:DUF2922 family protein [Enterococcus sp. DIV0756]|uniref:DUF2922 family protein n=1 Tax=Enterococcus sp. DIV0756 TaxID=2774636 RepID=UPI003F24D3C5